MHKNLNAIQDTVGKDSLRKYIVTAVYTIMYGAVGYYFELDLGLMFIIIFPTLLLAILLIDIGDKVYSSVLHEAHLFELKAEQNIDLNKKITEKLHTHEND